MYFSCFRCIVYACAICCSLQWRIQDFAEGGANPRGEGSTVHSECLKFRLRLSSSLNGRKAMEKSVKWPNGNSETKQLLNYHSAIRPTFPNLTNGNSATVLSPSGHSAIQTQNQTQRNLRYLENTEHQPVIICQKLREHDKMDCVVFLSLYLNVILVLLHEKFKNISHSLVHASKNVTIHQWRIQVLSFSCNCRQNFYKTRIYSTEKEFQCFRRWQMIPWLDYCLVLVISKPVRHGI